MDPVTAWAIIIIVGLFLVALTIALVRRWDRENRAKYPDRERK
jgi:uncharacterized membrane protein